MPKTSHAFMLMASTGARLGVPGSEVVFRSELRTVEDGVLPERGASSHAERKALTDMHRRGVSAGMPGACGRSDGARHRM